MIVDIASVPWSALSIALVLGVLTLFILRTGQHPRAAMASAPGSAAAATPTTPPPVDLSKSFTSEELAQHDGVKSSTVYIAVRSPHEPDPMVFDVSGGRSFYGPGGPYQVFAGKHASHGLAKASTDAADTVGDLDALSASEQDTLDQWYLKFRSKYPIVGVLNGA